MQNVAPKTNVLEDYNPFDDNTQVRNAAPPPTSPPTQTTIPAYNQTFPTNSAYGTAPQISTAELQVSKLLGVHEVCIYALYIRCL